MARKLKSLATLGFCWGKCLQWMDANARLGWYIAFLSVANVVLNVLDLVK